MKCEIGGRGKVRRGKIGGALVVREGSERVVVSVSVNVSV